MRIKRLYSYLIKNFLGTFLATFVVCLFIVLMMFLWNSVDKMIGKGLEISVLLEFLFYATLSLLVSALPLAILLSSLITFGNMGENLELLAMKAAGISLFKIMRPYVIFVSLLSISAFFYSNLAIPPIQTKLWTLLFSMKQKSPEIEIPEGSFYNGIDGYHIYVKEKDPKTKALKNIMIYDFSDGFNNSVVMVADSARLKTASNKQSLILDLYSGESFENLKKKAESKQKNVPYRRETFSFKEILIDFDANFNKADESIMKNRYLGKDLAELTKNMDSMQYHADSMCHSQYNMYYGHFFDRAQTNVYTIYSKTTEDLPSFTSERLLSRRTIPEQTKAVERAIQQTDRMKMDLPFIQGVKNGDDARIRRFDIERHRKFTIPLSCIIFFFIAAPLGAIIRKGGIGLPLVVSVIFFIIYYIIDNTGYKMAREGVWYVWQGIWLSSIVLFPLGILLTYMAAKDRSFNLKQPKIYWKKLKNFFSSKFGQKESYRERRGIYKERG